MAAVNSFAGSNSLTVNPRAKPLVAREALELGAPHVPELDVNPVGATLAQEDDRARKQFRPGRTKSKTPRRPGVTVLHGPNELGKSTLVEAIQRARDISFGISPHAGRRAGVTLPRQWQRHALALAEQVWSRRVARDVNTIF